MNLFLTEANDGSALNRTGAIGRVQGLPWLVFIAALALSGLVWCGLVYHLGERERTAYLQAERDAANLAIALEKQVERTISSVDQVLLFAKAEYEEAPELFDLSLFAKRSASLHGLSHQIAWADAAGTIRASSLDRAVPGAPTSISDREHFKVHAERADAGLFISRPLLARRSGRWSLQLSRRLTAGDGSFAGIVVISVDPDYLARLFAAIDVGEGGAVSLVGQDGYVRARSPAAPGTYEGQAASRPRSQPVCGVMAPGQAGGCRFRSSVDGIERVHAFRAHAELPLIVSVGKSVAAIEAQLSSERRRGLALGGGVTVVLAAAAAWLMRELRVRGRREAALRASEAALREAEAEYRALFENAVVGVYRSLPNGRQLRANPALVQLNGYGSEAEMLAAVNDIAAEWYVEPGRRDEFMRLMHEQGRVTDFVSEIYRHNTRERIWVSETAWTVRGTDGRPIYYEGTVVEATERVRARAALAESEARYRLLADNASDLIVLNSTFGGARSYVSPAVRTLLGYEPEEFAGLATEVLVHPDDLAAVKARYARLGPDCQQVTSEHRLRHKSGQWVWIEVVFRWTFGATGQAPTVIGAFRDVTARRAAQAALGESEARLRFALDAGGMYAWERDVASDHVTRLGGVADVLGFEPDASSDAFDACVHPDDRARVQEGAERAMRDGAPYEVEFRFQRPDGRQVWLLDVGRRVRVGDDERFLGLCFDITRRRAAEDALARKTALLAATLDNMDQGLVMVAADGGVEVHNRRFAELLDIDPVVLRGDRPSFDDVLARLGEFGNADAAFQNRVADRGAPLTLGTYERRRPTGQILEVSTVPVPGGAGEVVRTYTDVTAQREAQAAVRESERLYRLLADNSSDLIVLGHADGRRSYISPAVTSMLGYTVEEAHRVPMREWVHPDDLGQVFAVTQGLSEHAPHGSVVYRLKHRDARYIWVEAAFQRVVEPGGEITIITAIRDVSERQAQADALAAARDAAEAASQAKTDFLASMSHEIRTPLNGVIGYTELLLDHPLLADDQRRHLERIQTAGSALLTVVNDILDFSKIEAGQVELDPQPFSLSALIDNTVSITRGVAEKKGLELQVEIAPAAGGRYLGDQDRLRQVLLNLLNNAVKFTPHGSVTLRVAVGGTGSGGQDADLRFSVTDTGIGIPADKVHRLFARFSQVNGSIRREFGGTGLGLAISKRLVELMGGQIGVESEHLAGTTFWFEVTLPLAAGDETSSSAIVPAIPVATGEAGVRILLVEDLPINQELARTLLERAGHQVDVVGDGADAVMAVQTKAYDLVLMDVQMPGMDGITATEHIRALGAAFATLPIVALTANVLPHQVAEFRQAGMDDHVGKPFKRDELLKAIASWTTTERRGATASEGPGAVLAPALDQALYADLLDVLGSAKMAEMLDSLAVHLGAFLSTDAGQQDRPRLAAEAHAMVSMAGMLGFAEVSSLSADLEAACQAEEDVASLVERLGRARERALVEITTLRAAA